MTSGDTHAQTVELLDSHGHFGLAPEQVTIMQQEKVPALLDVDARIAYPGPSSCLDGSCF